MPTVTDYAQVLQHAERLRLVSAYFNSGAFTYPRGEAAEIVGWVGPDDGSIRAELQASVVRVPPPYESRLSERLTDVWQRLLPGPAWVLPKSHWGFELDHGHRTWLADALREAGVDPTPLAALPNAAAIVFEPSDKSAFAALVQTLLTRLIASDFAVLFPGYRHLVTLHHHKQVWWQTPDAPFAAQLRKSAADHPDAY